MKTISRWLWVITLLVITFSIKTSAALDFSYSGERDNISWKLESWGVGYNSKLTISGSGPLTGVPFSEYFKNIVDGAAPIIYDVYIEDGITSIGDNVFSGCSLRGNVKIPDSVTSIGYRAFYGSGLRGISIPNSVTSIGDSAFYCCYDLRYITIPDSVTSIGSGAFSNCTSLTTDIVIPDGVTCIESNTFNGCSKLTSITIPDSVTSIGSSAFSGCSGLKSITIPDSVTSIGSSAFSGCSGLTSITIPDSVTSIGSSAFSGCSGLKSLKLPDRLTSIGSKVFYDCSRLKSITIPDSVTSMGDYAFYCYGSSLPSITLPSNLTRIGKYALESFQIVYAQIDSETARQISKTRSFRVLGSQCNLRYIYEGDEIKNLEVTVDNKDIVECVFPNGVTSIESTTFSGCSKLKSVTIPDSVTSIGRQAFYNCSSLTSITIPDSVTSIGNNAFYNCSSLTSITIPDSVTSIGNNAFYYCNLKSITLPDNVTSIGSGFVDSDCIVYARIDSESARQVSKVHSFQVLGSQCNLRWYTNTESEIEDLSVIGTDNKDILECEIPNGVTRIENNAFSDYSSLTSISIPESVTSIGSSAFSRCSSLTSITIPDSVTSIGDYAFSRCSSLTSITIPDSVTSIGNDAFYYCSNLKSITLPDSVTNIGSEAFYCTGLTSITIPDNITSIGSSFVDSDCIVYARIDSESARQISKERSFRVLGNLCNLKHIYEEDEIKDLSVIGTGNKNIAECDIPNGVTRIGDNAFSGYSNLTSITIPKSVTSIGDKAFYNCVGLTSITFPDSVTSIGSSAFSGCSGLTSITLPDSVTSIGSGAFAGCSGLTSIMLSDSVTSIGSSAFSGCSSLASVTLPDNVMSIGSNAFDSGLIVYAQIDSETARQVSPVHDFRIQGNPCKFRYISGKGLVVTRTESGIVECEIPNGVTTIGDSAFSGRSSLTSITIPDSVTSIGSYAFSNCKNLMSVTIPDSVTSIGSSAFSSCKNLMSITLPDSITSIGDNAFSDCSGLTSIMISNGLTSIRESVFKNCSSLTSVTIPDGVTTIGRYAFDGCSNMTSITFPESLTSVDYYAFNFTCYYTYNVINIWWPVLENVSLYSESFYGGSTSSMYASDYKKRINIFCYQYSPLESRTKDLGFTAHYIDSFDFKNSSYITNSSISGSVEAGNMIQLGCTVFPQQSGIYINSYMSDNPAVGTVTNEGLFTAVAPGTVTITVATNRSNIAKTIQITVIRPYIRATKLSLSDIWVIAGQSSMSELMVTPSNADLSLTWSISNYTYAGVRSGKVTGTSVGKTTITVKDAISGLSTSATLNVCYPVTAVTFGDQNTDAYVGIDLPLTAQVTMRNQSCENQLVNFTSSNDAIATVNGKGVVRGLKAGTVTITASALNDSTISASITVKVKEPNRLTLPASLTIIESEAFADMPGKNVITVPEGVTDIADDAFAGTDAVLSVVPGTYAAEWAESHGMTFVTR